MNGSSLTIFWIMLKHAMLSFGGLVTVLPGLEADLMAHGWLSHAEFAETYALIGALPGPNSVLCPLLGYKIAGVTGMMAAFLGTFLPPLVLMAGIGIVLVKFRSNDALAKLSTGLKFTSFGLMLAATVHFLQVQPLLQAAANPLGRLAGLALVLACMGLDSVGRANKSLVIAGGALAWTVVHHL